ncbi:hypothetical protein AQUCO_02000145v1 [Aquilegia coerulea]|uniref:ethanolamine kinase n=1 Tax=Aquilegia coerulea TaxID=218851 RepID=A0A2G5DG37_AQUCA|nr:hypothetical protein AQUCO_02000145v1 [Aquilegia coerulea]
MSLRDLKNEKQILDNNFAKTKNISFDIFFIRERREKREEKRNREREMGAEEIWNAKEVSEEARDQCSSSDIPFSSLIIDIKLPLPQLKPRIINLCKDLFKKWLYLDDSRFTIETVSGGITNLLLKVSVREDDENDSFVTVRLFGPNTEFVIDRERELMAIGHLSTAGFGAKLLGAFGNGMVQSFINARTLSPEDMGNPKLAADIAKQLRRFHMVEIPGSKEPQLWNDMYKFLERVSGLKFDDSEKQRKYDNISFKEVNDAVSQLKDLTNLLNAPVVFAHNDLLSGNLMLNDDEDKLYFIDFEYGSYSYRGYDIANHFNEYAGFDCDYSLYPDKEAQYHFFRHYLNPDEPKEVPEEDLKNLYVETDLYKLASHLYWALWALIQLLLPAIRRIQKAKGFIVFLGSIISFQKWNQLRSPSMQLFS